MFLQRLRQSHRHDDDQAWDVQEAIASSFSEERYDWVAIVLYAIGRVHNHVRKVYILVTYTAGIY